MIQRLRLGLFGDVFSLANAIDTVVLGYDAWLINFLRPTSEVPISDFSACPR